MSTSTRFTIADLAQLPERLDDTRYELIDGELYVSHQPHWRHQYAGVQVVRALQSWDPTNRYGIFLPAPGVIFSQDEAVAPDLVWVARDRFASVIGEDGKLHAAPELVVEVLSPGSESADRDREIKLLLYERRGVREYWIVDWRDQTVAVHRRADAALRLVATLNAEDALTSPLLPGFAVRVSELCASPA